ncbi:MAG: hypothetical protein ACTSQY_06265 [Candidatus Odinarchaeia archaeon]
MVRIITSLKIISALTIAMLFSLVLIIVDVSVWQPQALPELIIDANAYLQYGFSLMADYLAIGFISLAAAILGFFDTTAQQGVLSMASGYYDSIWTLQSTAALPDYTTALMNLYYFGFQLLLVSAIIFSLFFILKLKSKHAIAVFLSLQGMVVLAALFGNVTLGSTSLASDLINFFTNPILLYVLLSYIYLEIVFTISHANDVFYENINYKDKISGEIDYLLNFSFDNKEKNTSKPKKETLVKQMESYKLSVYLNELKKMDPNVLNTMTAGSLLPTSKEILKPFLINSIIRIIALIFLTYIIVNPVLILSMLNAPLSLLESIEIMTPEIVIFLLLPISLMFPLASLIISYFKKDKNNNENSQYSNEKT